MAEVHHMRDTQRGGVPTGTCMAIVACPLAARLEGGGIQPMGPADLVMPARFALDSRSGPVLGTNQLPCFSARPAYRRAGSGHVRGSQVFPPHQRLAPAISTCEEST